MPAKAPRVRMYNVGFGDSFLVTVPGPERPHHILIDCGVFPAGQGPRPIEDVAEQIITDVTTDGSPSIDVVIATHRHADHVSGFDNPRWDTVAVGEVWLPWTEDYTNPQARTILERQSRLAKKLAMAAAAAPNQGPARKLAENALKNTDAMHTLHHGFRGAPILRYLPPPRRTEHTFTTQLLPGVTAHVLGPSRDPLVIRDMNPPAGHSYLRMAETQEALASGDLRGCRDEWRMTVPEFTTAYPYLALRSQDIGQLRKYSEADLLSVAVSLDAAVNGTSLMLLFEIGKEYLLFPGDAQWGTWQAALGDPEWRDLLGRVTFYKLSHHGSHNGSPPEFVGEILQDAFGAAMVSTREHTSSWKDIPRLPLLKAIGTKTPNIVRTDDAAATPAVFLRDNQNYFVDYQL